MDSQRTIARPCPTCKTVMCALGCKVTSDTLFWCPECGTIKPCDNEDVVPNIVRRWNAEGRAVSPRKTP